MDTQSALISLLKEMIAIPSPSGEEGALVEFLARSCKELGFDELHIDRYGSLTATMVGTKPGAHLLLDGHIDTVGVEDRPAWKHDPYQAEIADGLLYGRGTSDMKGALCAMLLAVSTYAKQTSHQFGGRISVSATVCEECFEGIAARLITKRCNPDVVIVGEATECKLAIGQRGRAEIVLQTFGKSCHSSNPEQGSNAALHMMKLLPYLEQIEEPFHPVLGKGILVLTDLISSPYPGRSVLPSLCTATFDRRLVCGETQASILASIQEVIGRAKQKDPALEAKVFLAEGSMHCYTGEEISAVRFFPAWLLEPDHPVVRTGRKALREAGLPDELSHYSFCTNASHFCAEAGIPTLGFGPSFERLAHVADEHISVEHLRLAYRGYLSLLSHFCP
ncbi:YgeY family selenium metabolism-linked hydrolase [Sphaerochaeta sp.]|uniref:YgeY family selenium metabolism-linked hydrolase n=1 Tax=Sphaerochaeta sp. TaxID=1972642 RepID=UPI003D0F1797